MKNKLFFSLDELKPKKNDSGGSLTYVTANEMPGLINMSFANLKLNKGGVQEPIWHPNANKIGYCLEGNALVSIHSPSSFDVFTVKEGDVFFIPQGYIHHIANTNTADTVISFAFNHVIPQVMNLAEAMYSINDHVFNATFDASPDFFHGLTKNKKQEVIKKLSQPINNSSHNISSRFKFDIASSNKPIKTKGGYLQLATKTNLPVLDGLGILGFGLNQKGVVEPHWHTNAGELVYIVKGKTKITVLSPEGKMEVLEVNGGEGAFAPASHFHNIENIGKDDVEVIAFFSHAEPDYIGLGEVVGAYSNDVLGSIFNVSPDYFDSFNKPEAPLVIVPV